MDASYSAWQQMAEERMTCGVESFAFLFDRRYANRLNRMSRVFFEAYVKATKEVAAKEDRFPTLSEIEAKMESGAVYAYKDRLLKNTDFFEEVKISWVSYLVPKAKMFVDASGTYTELAFNFDDGTVVLPTRRKVPARVEPELPESEQSTQPPKDEASVETVKGSRAQENIAIENIEADKPQDMGHPEQEPEPSVIAAEEPAQRAAEPANINCVDSNSPEKVGLFPDTKINAFAAKGEESRGRIKIGALGIIILIVVYLLVMSIFGSKIVYSLLLSSTNQGNFLDMNITNRDGLNDEIEMVVPTNIYRSMISRGGIITISSDNNTSIRLGTSSDASIRLCLSNNWTMIPVKLSLTVLKGHDSELNFVRGDYNVKTTANRTILKFNCTREGFSFEQRMKRWF